MEVEAKIVEYLEKRASEKDNRLSHGLWKPSSFGYCFKRQYLERQGEEPSNPITVETSKTFLIGILLGDFIQSLYPKVQSEVEILTDEVHGYADLVTEFEVVEIKSVGAWASKYLKEKKDETYVDFRRRIVEDKFHNILQLMYYVRELKKPKGRLVFVAKDNFAVTEFVFEMKMWDKKVQAELDSLEYYWTNQVLPGPKPRCFNGKECNYCPFENKCQGKPF
jgi:hypothetical protein